MKQIFCRLTVFAACAVSWGFQSATAQTWNLAGNNNATPTSILGTTNSVSVGMYTKNLRRLTIDTVGNVGIGTATPAATAKLDIIGKIKITDGTQANSRILTCECKWPG